MIVFLMPFLCSFDLHSTSCEVHNATDELLDVVSEDFEQEGGKAYVKFPGLNWTYSYVSIKRLGLLSYNSLNLGIVWYI